VLAAIVRVQRRRLYGVFAVPRTWRGRLRHRVGSRPRIPIPL